MAKSLRQEEGYGLLWERIHDLEEFDHGYLAECLGSDEYEKLDDDEIDEIYRGYREAFNNLMGQAWRFDN